MPSTEKMKRLFERHFSKIVSAGIVGSVPLLQIDYHDGYDIVTVVLYHILFLSPLYLGVVYRLLWVPEKRPVNKRVCRCSCFDTIFKGTYENGGIVRYKHLYFNATFQTLVIWITLLASIIVTYETLSRLLGLFRKKKIRWRMFILFVANLYPNYFSLWAFLNYINDGFYEYFMHQIFFTTTELFSTWNIVRMCSAEADVEAWRIKTIAAIGCMHIVIGGVDQFFEQLILWKGDTSQQMRSLLLVALDVLHVVLPLKELAIIRNSTLKSCLTRREMGEIFICILFGFIVGNSIFKDA